ncbi:hypothetical protein [Effusibacillus lacus]|uniref:LLM class flavin-dependent oxidoreductase n=1 Tax=Effusibacillus lacus TaxID=1348429 RepID=A0A292YTJ6_9BACL|nr:luciferase family oxidoreductase group 1 [Effusibacillus lacus]GAX91754.1 LLM class flavin-dependent oxidoreductase [Effusibacillus lacus]
MSKGIAVRNSTKRLSDIPLSVLDLAPIVVGGTPSNSFRNSLDLAQLAFASHFSPDNKLSALKLYRSSFRPSEVLDAPYAMVCVNVIAADNDEKARWLATSMEQQFLNLVRGRPGQLNPPVENMDELWTEYEKAAVKQQLRYTFTGGPETVKEQLESFLDATQADEIMINAQIFDHQARQRSYEIVSQIVS